MQKRLNQIFEEKGLTAAKFATLIGVNASTISHILAGRNKPGFEIINNIARVFPDINLSWLITGKEPMYNSSFSTATIEKEETPIKSIDLDSSDVEDKHQKTIEQQIPFVVPKQTKRNIKRIILIFDDGSFEDYQ